MRMDSEEDSEKEYLCSEDEFIRVPKKEFFKLMEDFDILLKNMDKGITEGRIDVLNKAIITNIDSILADLEVMSKSKDLEDSCEELILMRRRRVSKLLHH